MLCTPEGAIRVYGVGSDPPPQGVLPTAAIPRRPRAPAYPGTVIPMPVAALLASLVWIWPVSGPVVAPFHAPEHAFGPGHRGIDIESVVDSPVRAAHAGTVRFAGLVAGVPTVTIRNGPVTTSYQPVHAAVPSGAVVQAGDVIGRLGARHGACTCLHLGVRADGRYRDPLHFLHPRLVLKSPRMP